MIPANDYGKIPQDEAEIREAYAQFVASLHWPVVYGSAHQAQFYLVPKPPEVTLPEGFQILLEVGNCVRDGGHVKGLDQELAVVFKGQQVDADYAAQNQGDLCMLFAKASGRSIDGTVRRNPPLVGLGQWFNDMMDLKIIAGELSPKLRRIRANFVTLKYFDGYFQHATRLSIGTNPVESLVYNSRGGDYYL